MMSLHKHRFDRRFRVTPPRPLELPNFGDGGAAARLRAERQPGIARRSGRPVGNGSARQPSQLREYRIEGQCACDQRFAGKRRIRHIRHIRHIRRTGCVPDCLAFRPSKGRLHRSDHPYRPGRY